MATATDELHGQLDTGYPHTLRPELHKALMDHGIDYWVAQGITFWNQNDGCECLAYGYKADGVPKLAIKVVGFTDPEQAIAATLSAGTCKLERASWDDGVCTWGCICSACDAHLEHETGIGYNYCPICGAKVVDA